MDERAALLAQAAYYVATGIWPIVSPKTFQAVTGPKADMWLVKTFGLLVGAVGLAIARGAEGDHVSPETRILAGGSALALGGADAWYSLRGRIPKTYLLDAAAQALLLAALALARATSDQRPATSDCCP